MKFRKLLIFTLLCLNLIILSCSSYNSLDIDCKQLKEVETLALGKLIKSIMLTTLESEGINTEGDIGSVSAYASGSLAKAYPVTITTVDNEDKSYFYAFTFMEFLGKNIDIPIQSIQEKFAIFAKSRGIKVSGTQDMDKELFLKTWDIEVAAKFNLIVTPLTVDILFEKSPKNLENSEELSKGITRMYESNIILAYKPSNELEKLAASGDSSAQLDLCIAYLQLENIQDNIPDTKLIQAYIWLEKIVSKDIKYEVLFNVFTKCLTSEQLAKANSILGRSKQNSTKVNQKYNIDDLYGKWSFDWNLFDEFFNETIEYQIKKLGAQRPSPSEIQRRKNAIKSDPAGFAVYIFSKLAKDDAILLKMLRGDKINKRKTLEYLSTNADTLTFRDSLDNKIYIYFYDKTHIKYISSDNKFKLGIPYKKE